MILFRARTPLGAPQHRRSSSTTIGASVFVLLAASSCSSSPDEGKSPESPASKNGPDGCPVNTGFPGDDSCIAAPLKEEGAQMHYGPSDYDDPDDVALFVLKPGEEVDKCFFMEMPNETDILYGKIIGGMRPGSHHFIARAMEGAADKTGFQDCAGADVTGTVDSIGGSQFRRFEFPPVAPDYDGLAGKLPAKRQGMLNGHFINATEDLSLAEAWLNYEPADPDAITGYYASMSLNGGVGMRILPHSKQTLHYSCSPDQDVRLLNVSGHFHAHTVRFSAWKVDAEGVKTPLMQAFHWEELASFYLDSKTVNPESDPATKTDGALSGPITIATTDAIEWECEIDNTSDSTLKFRNEVQTGEMCMVVGLTAAVDGNSKPFTCNRN
jgi:hypothetical protein